MKEKIQYDINFIIRKENFQEKAQNLLDVMRSNQFDFKDNESKIEEIDIDTLGQEAMVLSVYRKDLGSFQVIIRLFDFEHITLRYAIDFDEEYSDVMISTVVMNIMDIVLNVFDVNCITAGENAVPYFINEIEKGLVDSELLYLNSQFINQDIFPQFEGKYIIAQGGYIFFTWDGINKVLKKFN